jgi:hypothetical protein
MTCHVLVSVLFCYIIFIVIKSIEHTPPFSVLKTEAVCSFETLVSAYKFAWHYNREE